MSKEDKTAVQSYVAHCHDEHLRRRNLFSQRWIGADYFYKYLLTIEQDADILEAEMRYLIEVYFQKGRTEFRHCDHETGNVLQQELSELMDKYVIEERAQRSGFGIGILELVRVLPLQIAQQLRKSRARPVGDLNTLPKFLAFNGGVHLIPETEEWEPMAVLWKMWKGSIERLHNGDLALIAEHVNLSYRCPSHINKEAAMEALNILPVNTDQVMSILRKVIRDFSKLDCDPTEEQLEFYAETLFPSYSDNICDFYTKNISLELEQRGRRKPAAATVSQRPVRNPSTAAQNPKNCLRQRTEPTPSVLERSASVRSVAELKRKSPSVGFSTNRQRGRGRGVPGPSASRQEHQSQSSDFKKLDKSRKIQGATAAASAEYVGRDDSSGSQPTIVSAGDNSRGFLSPPVSVPQRNLRSHREQKRSEHEQQEDDYPEAETFRSPPTLMTTISETSLLGDSRVASYGSVVHMDEVTSPIMHSPTDVITRRLSAVMDSTASAATEKLSSGKQPGKKGDSRFQDGLNRTGTVPKYAVESSEQTSRSMHSSKPEEMPRSSAKTEMTFSQELMKKAEPPSPMKESKSGKTGDRQPTQRAQVRRKEGKNPRIQKINKS